MNKDVILIKQKIIPILKKYRVTKAGIFGSYARGEQKKKSDVDILIEIGDWASLIDIAGLKVELQNNLKKKVDLVEYTLIRAELKKRILNEEISVFP